jgi:hypothetical protein
VRDRLIDLLDRLVNVGIVLTGDVALSIADIDSSEICVDGDSPFHADT